jgi:hypothetical protein
VFQPVIKRKLFLQFFCANVSTVDLIFKKLNSYHGVNRVDLFITTRLIYHQEWLKREIDKRIESYSSETTKYA